MKETIRNINKFKKESTFKEEVKFKKDTFELIKII